MDSTLSSSIIVDRRELSDGTSITFGPNSDHVWLRHWSKDGNLLQESEYSYERWEELGQQYPLLELSKFEKPRAASTSGNGNTIGKVVGETGASPVSASEANPPVDTGTKILDSVQLGLDAVGLIPGIGEFADLTNAGISALRGDWAEAALSLAAAIPFVGWFGTAAKAGKRGANMLDAASTTAKRVDNAPKKTAAGKVNNKDGGKVKGKLNRCILSSYKPDQCKKRGMTGHHVVPDRVFRLGTRAGPGRRQITGVNSEGKKIAGLSEAEGLVICVKGATPTSSNEHGRIHKIYDEIEKAIGSNSRPPGTSSLIKLELAGVAAVSKVTGCNVSLLAAQLRAHHQAKGMGPDFIVRADKTGRIPLNQGNLGTPNAGKF